MEKLVLLIVFFSGSSLTSINIPNSVNTIRDQTFDQCNSLTNVYFNWNKLQLGNLSLGNYLFRSVSSSVAQTINFHCDVDLAKQYKNKFNNSFDYTIDAIWPTKTYDANVSKSFKSNNLIPHDNNEGLWLPNSTLDNSDQYIVNITANKGLFDDESTNNVKIYLDNFLKVSKSDQSQLTITNNNDGTYNVSEIGTIKASNISVIEDIHTLSLQISTYGASNLSTQDIKFKFNDSSTEDADFTIHTFVKNAFAPQAYNITNDSISNALSETNPNTTITWSPINRLDVHYLIDTNSYQWLVNEQGYNLTFDTNSFTNEFVQIQNISYDWYINKFIANLQLMKGTEKDREINVSNININKSKFGEEPCLIGYLPAVTININKFNTNVQYDQTISYSNTNNYLTNKDDAVTWGFNIPSVLIPDNNINNLINVLDISNENSHLNWISVATNSNELVYMDDSKTYQLMINPQLALLNDYKSFIFTMKLLKNSEKNEMFSVDKWTRTTTTIN